MAVTKNHMTQSIIPTAANASGQVVVDVIESSEFIAVVLKSQVEVVSA